MGMARKPLGPEHVEAERVGRARVVTTACGDVHTGVGDGGGHAQTWGAASHPGSEVPCGTLGHTDIADKHDKRGLGPTLIAPRLLLGARFGRYLAFGPARGGFDHEHEWPAGWRRGGGRRWSRRAGKGGESQILVAGGRRGGGGGGDR